MKMCQLLITLAALLSPVSASAGLTLHVESDQASYALHEPVRIRVVFENTGPNVVRMMPPQELGANMEYMFYEITEPGGAVVRRYNRFLEVNRLIDPDYSGEPIGPGDRTELFVYPNLTRAVPGDPPRRGFTFDEVGAFKLRLAYCPPKAYEQLWQPSGAALYSNQLVLNIREPTAEEADILDAYWSGDRADLAMGDDTYYVNTDERRLREAINKYPLNPLTDYARFNLARGLLSKSSADAEAASILENLRGKTFRFEEVHSILAAAYSNSNQQEKAEAVLLSAINSHPSLTNNYPFMQRVILVDTRSPAAVDQWDRERCAGARSRFGGATLPSKALERDK